MCGPAAPLIISLAATAVSTGFQIAAAAQQGRAAQAQAEYDAQKLENQAIVEAHQARAKELGIGIDGQKEYGKAINDATTSSAELGFGSTAAIFSEMRAFQAFDSSTVAYNAQVRILGLKSDAGASRAAGKNAKTGATLSIVGSALAGVASIAGTAYGGYVDGVFGTADPGLTNSINYSGQAGGYGYNINPNGTINI